jgi:hypothetical protein
VELADFAGDRPSYLDRGCIRVRAMKPIFRKAILWAGIAWGIIVLAVGFFASFSIGANDTVVSVISFLLIFGLPIVASIAARWIPLVSGVALLVSVVVVLIWFYATGSMMDVLRVLSRVYLWFHVLFGILFIALAKQEASRASSPA